MSITQIKKVKQGGENWGKVAYVKYLNGPLQCGFVRQICINHINLIRLSLLYSIPQKYIIFG